MDSRKKKLTQYVVPTILGNCAYFLFTIIDGIFVGQGVGTDALGAVNLVWPSVLRSQRGSTSSSTGCLCSRCKKDSWVRPLRPASRRRAVC